jgi:hypothetical protein
MPTYGLGVEEIARKIADLRRQASDAGREPIPCDHLRHARRCDVVARLANAGVGQVLFDLPTLPSDKAVRALDEFAAVARNAQR